MKWFKHQTNAHKGEVMQEFYATFGVNEGHGLYFRFTEYLGDKWDGASEPKFRFLTSELRNFLKLSPKKLQIFAGIFSKSSGNSFEIVGDFSEIYFGKLLEIRHRDALNASTRQALIQHESGGEVEEKRIEENKEEEGGEKNSAPAVSASPLGGKFSSAQGLLDAIPPVSKDAMLLECKDYGGNAFLEAAVRNAFAYHSVNTKSAKWDIAKWISKIIAAMDHAKKLAPVPFKATAPPSRPTAAAEPAEIPVMSADEVLSNLSKSPLASFFSKLPSVRRLAGSAS